ncbi:MAG: glycosyltransferase family 2 protein [Anaerolineales bacterium]
MIQSIYSVLVNWNLKDHTLTCVQSLVDAGASVDHVIVVDNGSTDGSSEALRQSFGKDLHLIINDENLGFAEGSNLAIRHALTQGAEWVFILNNDTIVAPTVFDELASASAENEEYVILSPLILYHDEPDRIWHLGGKLIPGTLITRSLYKGHMDLGNLPPLVPVDFVSGSGMLVRREVFETIGLFDTAYFMYGEEVDFCWRARSAGYRLACAPRAKMWHKVSASASRDPDTTRYLKIRNQIRFYQRYANPPQRLIMLAFTLARSLVLAFRDLLKGQPDLIVPLFEGWADGWFRPGIPARQYRQ